MSTIDTTSAGSNARFAEILQRLSDKSVEGYYNPYRRFIWPESLPHDMAWMSDELVSTYGTPFGHDLAENERHALSRWESINFYSLNVEGIRELLIEVVKRIHTPGFSLPSTFFHHFLGEENEHMWFFAEFCRRYAGKIYARPKLSPIPASDPQVENLLVFARILLFEEIVDYYNSWMAADKSLHETIRQINLTHHEDESRHIAFGREMVSLLYSGLVGNLTPEQRQEIEQYLKRYLVFSLNSFYNPQVYIDAKVPDALNFRERVLADPGRRAVERKVLRKPLSFMVKAGIFADERLWPDERRWPDEDSAEGGAA
jgi:hypothetical protein